jgi:uncharacterized membrane protein YozB (DUF420 family)
MLAVKFMEPFVLATVSLFLQIVILILLFGSVGLKGKKKFRQHGITMLLAVVLHTITILLVMIPSFVSGFIPYFSTNISDAVSIIAIVHGAAGILAEVLGVLIVAFWRLQKSLQYCAPRKKLMRVTLILWLIALFVGVLLYIILYLTILPS